jgi:Vitamin K-dependent gamma-carboxylase
MLPLRYLLYPGHLFWTEQGYRFSWRVMLMEKAGTCFFFIKDRQSNNTIEIDNKKYLNYMQEKQMATQPDMLVDYAKFLKKDFQAKGFSNLSVHALCFVTLNGKPSRLFISDTLDLSLQSNSIFKSKNWIKPY